MESVHVVGRFPRAWHSLYSGSFVALGGCWTVAITCMCCGANQSVVAAVGGMRAKHVLIVADSCFTALERREAGLDEEEGDVHDRLSRLRARVVLTSGEPEPIQDGAGGGHSVFTGALLGALRENREILDGTSLFEEIQRRVSPASESPEYANIHGANHEGGDFLFVPLP